MMFANAKTQRTAVVGSGRGVGGKNDLVQCLLLGAGSGATKNRQRFLAQAPCTRRHYFS